MKLRNFFTFIAGLFALPFAHKAEASGEQPIDVGEFPMQVDWLRRRVTNEDILAIKERYRVLPAKEQHRVLSCTEWHEYKNSGGMVVHTKDPGKIPDSFVVAVGYF